MAYVSSEEHKCIARDTSYGGHMPGSVAWRVNEVQRPVPEEVNRTPERCEWRNELKRSRLLEVDEGD